MAKPQFSETQFVVGYLREYLNTFPFYPNIFWQQNHIEIPSTVQEIETGADFIFRYYSHSEFLQFKRSDFLCWRGKGYLKEPEKSLPKSFFDYYRFKVYNSDDSRQFEKLRQVSLANPNDRAFYVAPYFHTKDEFKRLFAQQRILENSITIDCSQFNDPLFHPPHFDIGLDDSHKIVYNGSDGYILSEPVEIRVAKGKLEEYYISDFSDNRLINTITELNKIRRICLEDNESRFLVNSDNQTNTFGFIYNYFLINYEIHWIPKFNNPESFQDKVRFATL
ncbi:MAG: hypothetical protein NVSMB45_14350 [Ginsengibacter sp.]